MRSQKQITDNLRPKSNLETHEIKSECGISVGLINLGARISSIKLPTLNGHRDVVLGYPNLNEYQSDPYYLGAICGRYAGRIGNGRFELNGQSFSLDKDLSNGPHSLHGGPIGLSTKIWKRVNKKAIDKAVLKVFSPNGDQGFPGNLVAKVKYEIIDPDSLLIDLWATTDSPSIINLASHAYFNLDGKVTDVSNHSIQLNAQAYTVQDETLLPTGEIRHVEGTPFDLRRQSMLKTKMEELRKLTGNCGFDQNYVLNKVEDGLTLAATLTSSSSDLTMQLYTDQPGLQLYTGHHLGDPFHPLAGVCLEAQGFPDAPNKPAFPSAVLLPEEIYRKRTLLKFKWS